MVPRNISLKTEEIQCYIEVHEGRFNSWSVTKLSTDILMGYSINTTKLWKV